MDVASVPEDVYHHIAAQWNRPQNGSGLCRTHRHRLDDEVSAACKCQGGTGEIERRRLVSAGKETWARSNPGRSSVSHMTLFIHRTLTLRYTRLITSVLHVIYRRLYPAYFGCPRPLP